jgi:hypothetical protein
MWQLAIATAVKAHAVAAGKEQCRGLVATEQTTNRQLK